MTRLYKRAARLTLYKQVAGNLSGEVLPNAVVIEDLRVSFQVAKDLGKNPNTAKIAVYNLGDSTRAEFQIKPLHIILEAGYDDQFKTLFRGDARWVRSSQKGAEWETRIECGDGARAFKHGRVNQSYKLGVSKGTVLKHIADTMGVSMPTSLAGAVEFTEQFVSGVSLDGPSEKQLDALLKPLGYNWSIQDGELKVLKGTDTLPGQAYVLNEDSGLIGTPELAAPKKPGERPTLTATSLLYPELSAGRKVKVESAEINGLFKIKKVTHSGDTHNEPWATSIQAVPV